MFRDLENQVPAKLLQGGLLVRIFRRPSVWRAAILIGDRDHPTKLHPRQYLQLELKGVRVPWQEYREERYKNKG